MNDGSVVGFGMVASFATRGNNMLIPFQLVIQPSMFFLSIV